MQTYRHRNLAGFTLTEVMIGMAVLSLSLLAAFGLVSQAIRMIRPSRDTTLSMQAAQIEMNRLRASWDAFEALESKTTVSTAGNPALSELRDGTAIIHKSPYAVGGSSGVLYSVAVEVNWTRRDGTPDTNVLVSIIGEKGIVK